MTYDPMHPIHIQHDLSQSWRNRKAEKERVVKKVGGRERERESEREGERKTEKHGKREKERETKGTREVGKEMERVRMLFQALDINFHSAPTLCIF